MRSASAPVALLAAALALAPLRTATGASPPRPGQPLLGFLDQAIRWYRQAQAQAQLVTDASDVVLADAARRQAREVLRLAFAFARGEVALEPKQAAPDQGGGGAARPDRAALAQAASAAADALDRARGRVELLQRRLAAARGGRRAPLERELEQARGELRLEQARHDALDALAGFAGQAGAPGAAGGGLLGQIDELQRSVPELAAAPGPGGAPAPAPAGPSASPSPAASRAAPTGILGLATEILSLARTERGLREARRLTADLRASVERLRAPLLDDARETLRRGDQLSGAADVTDAAASRQRTQELDQLTAHFRGVSGAVIPLAKALVLLDDHDATLDEWRAALDARYGTDLRALALHVGLLALGIAAVLAASAFWRRATLRYVHDLRRRQQSLLARRIIVAITVVLMVAFSFVTELGSVATFAGFITAGLAVALQNVILSVAAYFFLIGRDGIRVGDRVQIAGVTGEVSDIGLVRLHMMELRPDGLPTGRAVVFSNAVFFQPTASFFRQVPGASFTWHQVTLTLSPDVDYRRAERRLSEAVQGVFHQYEADLAEQHARMAQDLSISVREPRPQAQLHLTESGLEITLRFPVPLESASVVDDQVTRAVIDALDREPRLALSGSGNATIRATPSPAGAQP